jgi:hypothetical protein
MTWIGKRLESIASGLTVRIGSWDWQIDNSDVREATYRLVVCGGRDKRTIKIFSSEELCRCLDDRETQANIQESLTRLVAFLGGRLDSRSAAKKRGRA